MYVQAKDEFNSHRYVCACDHLPAFVVVDIASNLVSLLQPTVKKPLVLYMKLRSGIPF